MHVWWALAQWFNSLHPMLNTCARHLKRAVIWLPHYAAARQYLKREFSEICVQFSPTVYLEEQEVFNSFSLSLAERAIFCFYRVERFLVLEAIFGSKKKTFPRHPNESVKHKSAFMILIVIVLTWPLHKWTMVGKTPQHLLLLLDHTVYTNKQNEILKKCSQVSHIGYTVYRDNSIV